MKSLLRSLFAPLLKPLESGTGEFVYQPSHRKILLTVGILFSVMASFSWYVAGFQFYVAIFYLVSLVTLVVGTLGSDRAVATIWGTK